MQLNLMKLTKEDILKPGADIKAFKLNPNDPKVKKIIDDTLKQQDEILALKRVDPESLKQIINI